LVAISISTCAVAALLAVLGYVLEHSRGAFTSGTQSDQSLTVQIRSAERETMPLVSSAAAALQSRPQDAVPSENSTDLHQEAASTGAAKPRKDTRLAPDWRAMADVAATTSANEYFRKEGLRESMWRQSHSIMFEPADVPVTISSGPIIADLRFKHRSRVVGLGVNVGACFFGIPLLGVPVEQRTIAINVIVCGRDS
jgi:hypothetical protein